MSFSKHRGADNAGLWRSDRNSRGMEKKVLKFGDIKGGLNYCAGAKWNKYNREVMPSNLQSQQCDLQ